MAELSDSDKKILLGATHREDLATRNAAKGITDASRTAEARERMATDIISGAIGVGAVALVIGWANYYSIGTNYSRGLVIGCAIVVAASALLATWFLRSRRQNRRN